MCAASNMEVELHFEQLQEDFIIRPATDERDYDFVVKLSREEEWGCVGYRMVSQMSPVMKPGLFIGYLNGQRVGSVCACKYGEGNHGFAFIGLYMVDKPFRGKGYGSKVWNVMWELLGKDWNLMLDAALDMVPRYEEKLGFHKEWSIKEYTISCSKVIQALQEDEKLPCNGAAVDVQPIDQFDFDKLSAYDAFIFGFPRHEFLKKWITIPKSTGLVATNNDGDIIGYAVMQRSVMGNDELIGPLFSNSYDVAQKLLSALAKTAVDVKGAQNVRLAAPVGANPSAAKLIEEKIQCDTFSVSMRMCSKGSPVQMCMEKIIALTSSSFE